MYRILVVEDDEVIAKTIRQHLQSWNYEVFAVADFNSVMEEFVRSVGVSKQNAPTIKSERLNESILCE